MKKRKSSAGAESGASAPEPASPTTTDDAADTTAVETTAVDAARDCDSAQPVPDDYEVTNSIRVSSSQAPIADVFTDDGAFGDGAPTDPTMDPGVDVVASDVVGDGGELAATDGADDPGDAAEPAETPPTADPSRLESILESLLFAADRPLVLSELKRLLGERDGKRVSEALEALRARRAESGIQLVSVGGGWQLRTHPGNGAWVAKLIAGRPTRLSRAMMETLAIVAYRQPITRPEIDEIRGVDCGPVLRTLLDRALIRVIGKKEEVGRPMLYGTTPEFLKIFSLRDLADLPTLREFHELGAEDRAKVDATGVAGGAGPAAPGLGGVANVEALRAGELPDVDPDEEDSLIEALERASEAAGRATESATDPAPTPVQDAGATASPSSDTGDR